MYFLIHQFYSEPIRADIGFRIIVTNDPWVEHFFRHFIFCYMYSVIILRGRYLEGPIFSHGNMCMQI